MKTGKTSIKRELWDDPHSSLCYPYICQIVWTLSL
jgi:hypothetical protein